MLRAIALEDQEYISGILQFRIYEKDVCSFQMCNDGAVIVEKGTTRVFLGRKEFDKKFKITEEY